MIRIWICDDVIEELQMQKEMVQTVTKQRAWNVEIGCFQSGEELLCEIDQTGSMDIILMDIEMGGINGIETARRIREKDIRTIFIFISFHDQYCKQVINVQPFAYIDKPVSKTELETVLDRALKVLGEKEEVFEYTYKKVSHKILVRKIHYFESDRREVRIYSTDGIDSFYKKLDEVEEQLENRNVKFLRVSKSYLVNMNYIKEFRFEKVTMDDGRELRIGPRYKDGIRKNYIDLMSLQGS